MNAEAPQIGGQIRQLRRARKLSQAQLARDIGISASYLNLLEHNRRKLTVPLLLQLTQTLGLEIGDFATGDEARIASDLMEVFSSDIFGDIDITNHDIRDFANSNPSVARGVIHLFDQFCARGESAGHDARPETPRLASEQVSDLLQANKNFFETLEQVAARITADIGNDPARAEDLSSYIANVFGLMVHLGPTHGASSELNNARDILVLSDTLPPESRLFVLAKEIAKRAAAAEVDAIIENAALVERSTADLARSALMSYVAGAIVLPYTSVLKMAQTTRYDIDRIKSHFGASFEQVCHRLTTLQRPGKCGVPFHLIRTDIAGNISKRFSISGINIPRHGGACPCWNVYEAFMQPGRITIQQSQMPDGQRFFCIARTLIKGENSYNATLRHMSLGLGCDIALAENLIYADGVDLGNPAKLTPVGVSCRICPRENCAVRAFPALSSTDSMA